MLARFGSAFDFDAMGNIAEPLAVALDVLHQLGRQLFERLQHLPIGMFLAIERGEREQQPFRVGEAVADLFLLAVQHAADVVELMLHQAVGCNDRRGGIGNDRRLGGRAFLQLRLQRTHALDVLLDAGADGFCRRVHALQRLLGEIVAVGRRATWSFGPSLRSTAQPPACPRAQQCRSQRQSELNQYQLRHGTIPENDAAN